MIVGKGMVYFVGVRADHCAKGVAGRCVRSVDKFTENNIQALAGFQKDATRGDLRFNVKVKNR